MIDIHKLKGHVYDVVGALYEVHKELGAGLNEYCYQEGLQIQLEESQIPYKKELTFYPKYHGHQMKTHYRVDFLCKDDIVIECKSVELQTITTVLSCLITWGFSISHVAF